MCFIIIIVIYIVQYSTFSPSGCTFWGKKPWSRKKKLLWQLGTLIGAPAGIGLIAGIAIPAIIIGLSIFKFVFYSYVEIFVLYDNCCHYRFQVFLFGLVVKCILDISFRVD